MIGTTPIRRGLGISAGLDAGLARDLAMGGEQLGYHLLWSNDEPGSASLETLAHFAAAAPQLELGVGVLPLDRHQPRPADFLLTFLGAATGLIVLSRPMARDPSWQRLAGYARTTGTRSWW